MSVLVVGTIGLDAIKTPAESVEGIAGGSAVHFAYAASLLGPVSLVGVVGEDYPPEYLEALARRGVDTAGVERAPGRTFRWGGEYFEDMNRRETRYTELNVVETYRPRIPEALRGGTFAFLANGPASTQSVVLDQLAAPRLVICDTMDLWIRTEREVLERLLGRVDAVVLNDEEAGLLTGERDLVRSALAVLRLGPRAAIVKKGSHGALLAIEDRLISLPAFPVPRVHDPTGAGDSFAGGLVGSLARDGAAGGLDVPAWKRAVAYGTVAASFNVEAFGVGGLARATPEALEGRFRAYADMVRID
ncbi:MAG: sugar kinase [Planctomycetes bacterium]|nr:sugar kinase [Planctomycetota bacterium]